MARVAPHVLIGLLTLGLSQTTAADRFVPKLRFVAGRDAVGELTLDGNFGGSLTLAPDRERCVHRPLAVAALVALVAWAS